MTMRTSSLVALVALAGAAVAAVSVAPGCSSSSGGGSGTPSYTSRQPPTRPSAQATGTDKWFAVNALKLGLSPKTSTQHDANAWMDYGFDIDQRDTLLTDSKSNTNTCSRVAGAPGNMLLDGNGGIDNNFGGHIMQTIEQLKPGTEATVNTSISDGGFTLLLHLTNYTTADNSNVPGELFIANDHGDKTGANKTQPTWGSSDTGWPVVPSSLTAGATTIPGNATLKFSGGYVSNGYWVSGDFGGTGTLNLNMSIAGTDITLPIDSGIVTFKLADGTDGTIAGLMGTQKLQDNLGPVAQKFGICPSDPLYTQVIQTLTMSADLTGGDPTDHFNKVGQPCDSISIAIGFTMTDVGAPTMIHDPSAPAGPGKCDDGGVTDAATGGTDAADAASGG